MRHLEDHGIIIETLTDADDDEDALTRTRLAMEQGADAIAQATLTDGQWFGRADVLRRVDSPSRLGSWSYEVYDCKLASETKAGTVLQLSLYSDLVAAIQGVAPERMYVVPPSQTFEAEVYRFSDFAAYYRYVKQRLENSVAVPESHSTYPEPVTHCAVCRWYMDCDAVLRRDDHLSLVAGISKLQRKQLITWGVQTVEALAFLPIPLQHRPNQGSADSYIRVREQARVQIASRLSASPVYEILAMSNEHGFAMLPEPSRGDTFFDLEGDPFVGRTGREYLFGFVHCTSEGERRYESRWGLDHHDEKEAFEWFVDCVMTRWAEDPAMHIYHFTAYEPSALKRLMG